MYRQKVKKEIKGKLKEEFDYIHKSSLLKGGILPHSLDRMLVLQNDIS